MSRFQEVQLTFAKHLKDPESNSAVLDIEERRLAIYRDLFFNNIVGFLDSGFPVLASLYKPQDWHQLARLFYASHYCESPYFTDISLEFVNYLEVEHQLRPCDPPFLVELAHYEWLELSISIRQSDIVVKPWDGLFKVDALRFSPFATLASYQFPVHQISNDFQPQEPSEMVYLVVYRNEQDEVNFILLNQITAYLLNLIQVRGAMKVAELKLEMSAELPHFPKEQLNIAIDEVLNEMFTKQILFPSC